MVWILVIGIILFILGAFLIDFEETISTILGVIGTLMIVSSLIGILFSDDKEVDIDEYEKKMVVEVEQNSLDISIAKANGIEEDKSKQPYLLFFATFNHSHPHSYTLACPICSKTIFFTPTNGHFIMCTNCDTQLIPALVRAD